MRTGVSLILWMAGGAIIWAAHFMAVYGYTAIVCARGLAQSLGAGAIAWTITLMTALAAVAAAALLRSAVRQGARDFHHWMRAAVAGLALLAIVLQTLPAWMVPPCE